MTNELVKGFSSSIEEMQNSIVESCDTLFSGLSEADFTKIQNFRIIKDTINQPGGKAGGKPGW